MKDEKIFITKLVTKCSVLYDYIRKDKTRIPNMDIVILLFKKYVSVRYSESKIA